ncbi:MAG: VWA domain-containing protein [Acidobacteria bacterium]|nr:VWA domain-containing protein [Acidobacteriota bacterium]MBV9145644.1 VWA domain-containing protein [Acidobacteriota bacterium]MBV9438199.1 VWA domain-containing protein [Acidobacteriota bacterium]
MKRALFICFLIFVVRAAFADSGILIPGNKSEPDPSILSLAEMEISITIDNGDARVYIRQIFANHTLGVQEGNYLFALPSRATISDFAVWEGPTRIPAVILERKRAGEIYEQLTRQMIDPGLLQQGERGPEEARRSNTFSARIFPIPGYGDKRLEIEYHENIPAENLASFFAIPLHPDAYQAQVAGKLRINFELRSAHDLAGFDVVGSTYPLKIAEKNAHEVKASFESADVALKEDFAVRYRLDSKGSDPLDVITYRNPDSGQPNPTAITPERSQSEPGFFEAQALLGAGAEQSQGPPKTVIVLFDTSLSMQWEKLERSYMAMERVLRSLRADDRFNLLLFNNRTIPFQPTPIVSSRENVDKAIAWVRAGKLRGGTDLQQALGAALSQAAAEKQSAYILLLSDGGATRGIVQSGELSQWYAERWKQAPAGARPHTYVFAVGDDANLPLLRMLARNDGAIENVLSTEPAEFKLNAFISKIGRTPVNQLSLTPSPAGSVQMVYPLQDSAFSGSIASWVGQYSKPAKQVAFTVNGMRDDSSFEMRKVVLLPERSLEHPQLPRLWARARVDALLEKIEREGEDEQSIDEIIRLSRKYKFVTPYTSLLAVPRALLRPRVIRPGDPVLRVHTDDSIRSVIAIFPFGLTKRLRHLPDEQVWETRFLAPDDMQDGTYSVRLILRDRDGSTYREAKTFVIASKPPVVRIHLASKRYHRGDTIPILVKASVSTRTLTARLEEAAPIFLHWNQHAGMNSGELQVPSDLPAGNYQLTVIAEDIAHNIGTQEVQIEILP